MLLLASTPTHPQAAEPVVPGPALRFHNLGNRDGLSQMTVAAIVQDHLGFLWFGTEEGLDRYDGYRFQTLRHDPNDPASLPNGAIEALIETRSGHLWVGTHRGDLGRLDPRTGVVTRYPRAAEGVQQPSDRITRLMEGPAGRLWVGTRSGLSRFDPQTGTWLHFHHQADQDSSLSGERIHDLAFDPSGVLWVASDGGLDRFDPATGRAVRQGRRASEGLGPEEVRRLHLDHGGTLWVGTWGGGLYRYQAGSGHFEHLANGDDPEDNKVRSLHRDRSGVVWLGTQGRGLMRFDPLSGRFSQYRRDPDDLHSLAGDTVLTLLEDRVGDLWGGTWGFGVSHFDPTAATFEHHHHQPEDPTSLAHSSVRALLLDRSGGLWVGTHGGGLSARGAGQTGFSHWRVDPPSPSGISSNVVYALLEERGGLLWVGTSEGIDVLDAVGQRVVARYRHRPDDPLSLGDDVVRCLYQDRQQQIWIGTGGAGLDRFDPASATFVHYRPLAGDPDSLPSDRVYALLEDSDGALWIGTGHGLARHQADGVGADGVGEPADGFVRYLNTPGDAHSLRSDVVLTLHLDHAGTLWVGTQGGGLNRFDANRQSFTATTQADGLANDVIYSIAEDSLDRLWLGTNRGLSRFDPASGTLANYDPDDGLPVYELNTGAVVRHPDGRLSFGGVLGLVTFRPEDFHPNPHAPPVVLTAFDIFQQPAQLGRAPPYLEEVTLAPDQTFFSFELAALDYRRSARNRYAYRLEGLEDGWVEAGERRFVSYTKVPPGEYVFRAKASNNDGVWNEQGTSLRITIEPPLWARWWAYLTYFLTSLGALGGFVQVQRLRVRDERAVNQRLREIDRFRDELLANTSHELRTPLFGMTGLAESLLDGVHGTLPPPVRRDLAMIVGSGRRLATLVDDLLDISRLRHHRLELRRQPVDLRSLVEVALTLARPALAGRNLVLSSSVPADLPPADADENRLAQVLHNLIDNALKLTDEGSIDISATVDGDHLVLWVSDTGIGIDPAAHERIFEPFEQADGSIERHHGGTGIGLTISRRLVELHGGRLWLESSPGTGSTFFLTLPIADRPAEPTRSAPAQEGRSRGSLHPGLAPDDGSPAVDGDGLAGGDPSPGTTAPSGQPATPQQPEQREVARILLVDDEPVNRHVLLNHLSQQGYEVHAVASGAEALEQIDRRPPDPPFDLVLLDVMMPRMSGYEVCRILRRRFTPQQLPILFLTAKGMTDDLMEGFAVGANDYLTKPVAKGELLARVHAHLDLLHIHRGLEQLLEQRARDLRERERLVSELERFNRTISHDLRNPLFTIKSYLGRALRGAQEGAPGEVMADLRRVGSAADRMDRLLDELVLYSSVGQHAETPEPVSLVHLVADTLERLAKTLEQTAAEVVVPPDLPTVLGQPALLRVLFQSLLDNALTFGGDQPPRIELGWRHLANDPAAATGGDPASEQVEISLRDHGIGIEPAYLERVFDLFERLTPDAASTAGTGVGLALARRIVEAHGGRIWAESEGRGRGATLRFTLTAGPTKSQPAKS